MSGRISDTHWAMTWFVSDTYRAVGDGIYFWRRCVERRRGHCGGRRCRDRGKRPPSREDAVQDRKYNDKNDDHDYHDSVSLRDHAGFGAVLIDC